MTYAPENGLTQTKINIKMLFSKMASMERRNKIQIEEANKKVESVLLTILRKGRKERTYLFSFNYVQ